MRQKRKGNKVPKITDGKYGIGDLGENDVELFKHLPDPEEINEAFNKKARQSKKIEKRK